MARVFALPLAGLLAAAALFRALQPSPPPPVRAEPVAAAPMDVVQEPAPEPAALPTSPAPPSTAFVEPVLRADELRPLLDARFSDDTILAFARVSGRPFRPSAEEVDALRQAGMSDTLLGRRAGVPVTSEATSPAPPSVYVTPVIHVYSPVTVTTVIEAPPPPPEEPFISTSVLVCAPHGRYGCCAPHTVPMPAIYQKPPTFKTHAYMPTKRSPTAKEAR